MSPSLKPTLRFRCPKCRTIDHVEEESLTHAWRCKTCGAEAKLRRKASKVSLHERTGPLVLEKNDEWESFFRDAEQTPKSGTKYTDDDSNENHETPRRSRLNAAGDTGFLWARRGIYLAGPLSAMTWFTPEIRKDFSFLGWALITILGGAVFTGTFGAIVGAVTGEVILPPHHDKDWLGNPRQK